MTTLEVRGNWVYIRPVPSSAIMKDIAESMRFQPIGYEYSEKYKNGEWDGYINLYHKWHHKFPSGFLEDVEMLLQIHDAKYRVIRPVFRKVWADVETAWNPKYALYPYQKATVAKAMGMMRGIIHLPTGTGKTVIGCRLIHEIMRPAVIFVTRKEIMRQWVDSVKELLGIDAGVVGDGEVKIERITVAMVQTVSRLPKELFSEFAVTIIDECHHQPADQVYDISMASRSRYIIGLSATPRREDGKDIMMRGGIGPIIVSHSISEMIKRGSLAKPTIYLIDMAPISFRDRDKYHEVYRKAIIDNNDRNDKIVEMAERFKGKQIYIHVKQIRHGKLLADMIPEAEFIYGDDKTEVRQDVIDRFKNGQLKVLVSTLLGEGVDIPAMEVLILASGGLSETFVKQVIGRVLRVTADKKRVIIGDFIDKAKYLYRHALKRIDIYQSEPEFEVIGHGA